jgi:hypothetical protein
MILAVAAASVQAVLSASGSPFALPFKICVVTSLFVFVVRDLISRNGSFPLRIRRWFHDLSAIEYIAFALGLLAIFNSIIVNRQPAGRCLNEAGGFLLAVAGIGSFLRHQKSGSSFIVRLLWVMVLLSLVQLFIGVANAWQSVLSALFYPSNMVSYIKTSWDISRYFSNPNTFGFIMMTGGISCVALIIYHLGKRQNLPAALASGSVVLCMFGILLSASRASMLGLGVSFAAVILIPSLRNPVLSLLCRHPYISAAFVSVMAGVGFFFFENHFFLLSQKFDNGTIYRSAFWSGLISDPSRFGALDVVTANRYSYWKGFLADQFHCFLTPDFFFGKADYKAINPIDPGMELHNVYLEMWGKYGIICSLGLIAFLIAGLKNVLVKERTVFLAMIPLAFMAHGFFEDKIFINSLHPQMLFLYCVLLCWLTAEKSRADFSGRVS